jgi:outer membrane protein
MNKGIFVGFLLLTVVLSSLLYWQWHQTPRIACVRTAVVIEGYLGLKEVRQKYQQKVLLWQASADTLQEELNQAYARYQMELSGLSGLERKNVEAQLAHKQAALERYQAATSQKAQEEDEKLTQGTLLQINSFIGEYARRNGYDVVLGATASGNLLYTSSALDVTEDLLKELNAHYAHIASNTVDADLKNSLSESSQLNYPQSNHTGTTPPTADTSLK